MADPKGDNSKAAGELDALETMEAQEETAAGFSSLSDIDAWLQKSASQNQEDITKDNMNWRDFPEKADYDKGEMAELTVAMNQENTFLSMFAPVRNQLTQNIADNNTTISTTLLQMDPFKKELIQTIGLLLEQSMLLI